MNLSHFWTFSALIIIIITCASSENEKVFKRVMVLWDPEDKPKYSYFFTEATTNNLGEVVPLDNVTQWGRFSISVKSTMYVFKTLKKNCVTGIANVTQLQLSTTIEEIEPGAFRDLPQLEELKLSKNKLKTIKKDTFAGLPISSLQLSLNKISVLEPGAFQGLKNLSTLILYGNWLEQFSDDVFDHPSNLTFLNLDENRLTNIESLASLRQLKYLSINTNYISSLPKDLFKDTSNLEEFRAESNQISSIPQDLFKNTPNLKIVTLNRNQLTTIPEGLFSNTKIERLELSFNQISSIPLEVFDIPTLETLNLGSNRLTVWSSRFLKNTPNLKDLIVSENSVETLPDESFSSGLMDINFSNNKIVDVADGAFKKVGKMNHLNVGGNPFSEESLRVLGKVEARYKNVQSIRLPCSDPAAQFSENFGRC